MKKTRRCRSQAEEQYQTKGKQREAEDKSKTEESKAGQDKDCVEETRRGRRSRGGLRGEKRMEEVSLLSFNIVRSQDS